jgi:hypothetical protein
VARAALSRRSAGGELSPVHILMAIAALLVGHRSVKIAGRVARRAANIRVLPGEWKARGVMAESGSRTIALPPRRNVTLFT